MLLHPLENMSIIGFQWALSAHLILLKKQWMRYFVDSIAKYISMKPIKAVIASDALKMYPDHNKPLAIYTDASNRWVNE